MSGFELIEVLVGVLKIIKSISEWFIIINNNKLKGRYMK